MNKHTLLRGSFLLGIVLLFCLLVFEQSSQLAAAQSVQSAVYGQYLPVTYIDTCSPLPLISPNDPAKDLVVEKEINKVRENHGLPMLKHSDKIAQAALRHSNDMAINGIRDHIGSDGSTPGDRLNDACYHWLVHGEIIAGSTDRSIDKVIIAWMNSPTHRDIILSDLFIEFGAAYAYNQNSEFKHFYTVDFGMRYAAARPTRMDYYTCTYSLEDETGSIWMNIHSIWPCEDLFTEPGQ